MVTIQLTEEELELILYLVKDLALDCFGEDETLVEELMDKLTGEQQ